MNIKVKQHDESDCGAACIASVARHYGKNIPIALIREESGTSRSGTTIKGIIDACRATGFSSEAYKDKDRDVDRLRKVNLPVILHTVNRREDLHFVVLYEMKRKKAVVMDPATGTMEKMGLDRLAKEWTGYLVTMSPDPQAESLWESREGRKGLLRYFHLIDLKEYALMLAGAMAYIAAGICTALFLQLIIDKVLPSGDVSELVKATGLMLAIMVCTLLLGYGRVLYSLRLNLHLDSRLVMGYLSHLFRLPVSFFTKRGAGELNSRIGDISKIRNFLTEGISGIVTNILILAVSFLLMFTRHWRLSLMMLAFIPLYAIIYAVADRFNRKFNREIIESSASFEEKTVESITGVKVLKYFGGQDSYFRAIRRQYMELVGKLYRGGRYAGYFASWSDAVSKIMTVTLLTAGSVYIFAGNLTVGELVSFYSLTVYFSTPLSQLVSINDAMTEAGISAERIGEIEDLDSEGRESLPFTPGPGDDIVIDNIEFSYPGCPVLLKNFSMRLPAGKITALQGESGCGKSSIAGLLMRDYPLRKGRIFVGDTPIDLIDPELWRNYISIVPQDAPLLNGSILDNITCLDSEPDLDRVSDILKELGLAAFIRSLPLGLLTKVGDRGSVLSGGQKQRIAFARVLYHNPQVIILDEATSSLDEASQSYILDKIKDLRDSGKTILMITHKSDNVRIADYRIDMNAHS